ncbi:hypothetical protein DPMN_012845 [Dreissena polymorpha]|uniref:Uncharacterized protein n=1 Tax=Dreissena polymorpha TaxID=45954 RepID=A0A9D4N6S2_DREPO|nr:hypothetical protein DPMN_012845 [Dreissena polymorpha]
MLARQLEWRRVSPASPGPLTLRTSGRWIPKYRTVLKSDFGYKIERFCHRLS